MELDTAVYEQQLWFLQIRNAGGKATQKDLWFV